LLVALSEAGDFLCAINGHANSLSGSGRSWNGALRGLATGAPTAGSSVSATCGWPMRSPASRRPTSAWGRPHRRDRAAAGRQREGSGCGVRKGGPFTSGSRLPFAAPGPVWSLSGRFSPKLM